MMPRTRQYYKDRQLKRMPHWNQVKLAGDVPLDDQCKFCMIYPWCLSKAAEMDITRKCVKLRNFEADRSINLKETVT